MPEAAIVGNIRRTDPAPHFHIGVVDDHHRQRTARRQARLPVERQIFQLTLEPGIQRRHHFLFTAARQYPTGKQRGQLRHLSWKQPYRFFNRLLYRLIGPDALTAHPRQDFIARGLSPQRPTVRT